MQFAYLIWSLIALGIWLIIYWRYSQWRREILLISFGTLPLGLSEPLFVPGYWNPPTLFNLAQNIGFDIESLIFSFAMGGIASVLYNILTKVTLQPLDKDEKRHKKHRLHALTLAIPVVIFLLLVFYTNLNHIYCSVIALFIGALAAIWCRPDLKIKILIGGILFTILYFFFFVSLIWVYPLYVETVWNLKSLTQILVLGIPLEEYLFSFTFGMFWSSLYEHIGWYKLT